MTRTLRLLGATALTAMTLAPTAAAQLIDDIEAHTEQGVTEVRLQFNMPVRYVKHFPQERGELVKLYLQALTLDGLEEIDRTAYKRTPAAPHLPPFKVLYTTVRNCFAVLDPVCLDIQFSQPVHFTIRQGDDGRSILLHILPDTRPQPGSKPVPPPEP
jgi:hypothetical protein